MRANLQERSEIISIKPPEHGRDNTCPATPTGKKIKTDVHDTTVTAEIIKNSRHPPAIAFSPLQIAKPELQVERLSTQRIEPATQ